MSNLYREENSLYEDRLLYVIRLANAIWCQEPGHRARFIEVADLFSGIRVDLQKSILDTETEMLLTMNDLIEWLPAEEQKYARYNGVRTS
jgi:hypothetical protein